MSTEVIFSIVDSEKLNNLKRLKQMNLKISMMNDRLWI